MGAAATESGLVATRYAAALVDMAQAAGTLEKVEQDMADLRAMLEGSEDLRRVTGNPLIKRTQQKNAMMALAQAAKFQTVTANFLAVLADNGRLFALKGVIEAFRRDVARRRGVIEAKVETAYALTPAQTKALQEQLAATTGASVTLSVSVNKELLGGMIVTYGSRMIDDSVKRKLERLQRAMNAKETNINTHQKKGVA